MEKQVSFTGNVLALDLATVTGWCFGRPGKVPVFGHTRFIKPGGSRAAAYRAFREWLETICEMRKEKPDLIVFESPAIPSIMAGKTNIDTIKLLIGLAENLEEFCHDYVELREASVGQVRSHFIGQNLKAAIAKPMVMERCQALGWNVADYDEADACALWDYQCCHLRPDLGVKSTPLFAQKRAGPKPRPSKDTLF
jgi:hypothetical protein